nr:hypothetical protein [Tanacetum cinerariifolium]
MSKLRIGVSKTGREPDRSKKPDRSDRTEPIWFGPRSIIFLIFGLRSDQSDPVQFGLTKKPDNYALLNRTGPKTKQYRTDPDRTISVRCFDQALNVDNVINEEVTIGSKARTFEKRFMEYKLVLVDDDEKPLEKVDYPVNSYSDDEGFGTCSVLFGFQLVLLYELTMEKGFLSVKGRGIGKGDKEKMTTLAEDPTNNEKLLTRPQIACIRMSHLQPVSYKNGASTDGKMKPEVSTQENSLVPTSNMDSESEVEALFDETVNLMASTSFKGGSDRGNSTNTL